MPSKLHWKRPGYKGDVLGITVRKLTIGPPGTVKERYERKSDFISGISNISAKPSLLTAEFRIYQRTRCRPVQLKGTYS
jgi:hypothetical protein